MSIICCLESDIIIIFLSIRQTGKNQTTGHQLPLLSEFECKRQCVSVMKFLFYHSQLRIREHLTHKQVLLNFSNYIFFCLYSNRSGNIFPYEFNFPKEIPGYTYAYNSRRGDYLSLDSPTSSLKKHHSHAVIFCWEPLNHYFIQKP